MANELMMNVLLTGAWDPSDDGIVSMLAAAGIDARIEPWHSEIPALVETETFDAIVVRLPLPGVGLGVLLSSIRSKEARCRRAGLVVLTPEVDITAIKKLVGRGINRVLPSTASAEEIIKTLQGVQGAAQRFSIRLPVQLEVTLPAGDRRAYCQTENLSESGMLLRGIHNYPLGTRFSFELKIPGTQRSLEGIAEVTRATDADRERIEGLGARFVEVDISDRSLLDQFLVDKDEPSN